VHFFIGAMTLSFWPVISVVWFRVEISPSQFFAYWAFEVGWVGCFFLQRGRAQSDRADSRFYVYTRAFIASFL
jgi:hypothetical protein